VCSFGRFVAGNAGHRGDEAPVGGQMLLVGSAGRSEGVGEQVDRDVVVERGPGPHLASARLRHNG